MLIYYRPMFVAFLPHIFFHGSHTASIVFGMIPSTSQKQTSGAFESSCNLATVCILCQPRENRFPCLLVSIFSCICLLMAISIKLFETLKQVIGPVKIVQLQATKTNFGCLGFFFPFSFFFCKFKIFMTQFLFLKIIFRWMF